jgi:hypothetical protein
VGVVYKGPKPAVTGGTINTGALGAKGVGGKAGQNDGVDGLKQNDLEVM